MISQGLFFIGDEGYCCLEIKSLITKNVVGSLSFTRSIFVSNKMST